MPTPKSNEAPTHEEMLACLERSGYCFESRLVKLLNALDLFVESSQSLLDETTGKNREVDIVAEPRRGFGKGVRHDKTCVQTTFVIEAINNLLPAVLLTPKQWTPNTVYDDYLPFEMTPPQHVDYHPFLRETHEELFNLSERDTFSQYCVFSRKKAEGGLMASHSEDLHASIQKAVDYSLYLREQRAVWMRKAESDDYHRIFNWQPVVTFQNDLFSLSEDPNGANYLRAIDYAFLELNFHRRGEAKSVAVAFVTERAMQKFILDTAERDQAVEAKIAARRG